MNLCSCSIPLLILYLDRADCNFAPSPCCHVMRWGDGRWVWGRGYCGDDDVFGCCVHALRWGMCGLQLLVWYKHQLIGGLTILFTLFLLWFFSWFGVNGRECCHIDGVECFRTFGCVKLGHVSCTFRLSKFSQFGTRSSWRRAIGCDCDIICSSYRLFRTCLW